MRKYRAIIFDLDDTLYPERDYVHSGFRAVAVWAEANLGIPAETGFSELVEIFDHGIRDKTFDHWLNHHHLNAAERVPQLVKVYREHSPEIHPYKEVPALLSSLQKQYRLALLSDGYLAVQKRKLSAVGLASYFEAVVFSDEWGREAWKPNSWIYGLAVRRLGVEAHEAVYVGDNPNKDFLGARLLKMWTVRLRISSGVYARENPPDPTYAAHVEVKNHKELLELLLQ